MPSFLFPLSVPNSDIGFMCFRIHKRENQVVEIEESTLSRGGESFGEGGCSYQRFNKNYLTLFVIRQSSSSSPSSSSSSSVPSNGNDDLNNMSDKDNPSSSSLDPALHSNPSVSSAPTFPAPSFSLVNIKYLALLISLVISQTMMTEYVSWAKIILPRISPLLEFLAPIWKVWKDALNKHRCKKFVQMDFTLFMYILFVSHKKCRFF